MARRIDRAPRTRARRFTPEFKVEAVLLMRERLASGQTLERISEELEIGPDLLRVWGKAVAAAPPDATPAEIFVRSPGRGTRQDDRRAAPPGATSAVRPESLEQELARVRRENERLRQERDFLKKAAAFFAKESR